MDTATKSSDLQYNKYVIDTQHEQDKSLSPDTDTSTSTSTSTAEHEHTHKHDHIPTIEKALHINDTHHANKHVSSSSDTSLAPISTSSFYSINGQHERWRNPKFRFMVYNIVLLACGWA